MSYVWPKDRHVYWIVREGTPKTGNVLLRALLGTAEYFGLDQFPSLQDVYTRRGSIHLGKWRTSPRNVSWRGYRIAIPDKYASGRRYVGWSIALSANHRQFDLAAIARVIEAKGVPWKGFQNKDGARHTDREAYLVNPPPVKP